MSIRTRRLIRDFEKVRDELGGSPHVSIKVVAGNPPNHYQVTYFLNGLMWNETTKSVQPINKHIVDILLPPGYPKQSPRCVMRTPIWHANIGDYVCIGDYWSAGVTLVDIIAHIGDMIQYRTFNLKSPVNKAAALWTQENILSFPIGTKDILPPESRESDSNCCIDVASDKNDMGISLGPARKRKI